MYEKKFCFILIFCIVLFSCKSTELLSDDGTGIDKYRELQIEIRTGETDLAITGTEIENSSRQLGEGIRNLEQSIEESERNEQELGEILQRIRGREIKKDKLIELGIEFNQVEESENKN